MRPAGMVRHAECRHFDATDLDAVEVLLRGRNGLAIMQPQREIAVCPLVEFSRQVLDALRESPWVPPERDVPIYLFGRGGSRAADARHREADKSVHAASDSRATHAVPPIVRASSDETGPTNEQRSLSI